MLNAKPSKWSLLNYYTRRQSNTKPKMSLIPVEDVIETTETTDSTEPKVTIVKQATPLNSKKRKCEESGKENGKCGPTVKKKKVNCTGKHNTRKNVGRVRIGKSSEFVVETWQYFVHRSNYFTSKISAHTNCGIVADLKRKLTEKQLERFRSSCFGHFLDMSAIVVQNQLIHALLLREVQPPRVKEMWFRVNNTNLRFGIQEFGIITGLKCQGDYHKDYTRKEPNRLMEVYFGGALMVKKRALSECFLENEWDNNDDGLKLAVLYFIHTFLFSTRNDVNQDTNIKKSDFDLVEYGQWETFPWGCKLFDIAWNTMHDKLRGQSKMFRYAGFPLALQLWFYECCPTVDKKLANCVANSVPRILNWEVLKQLSQHELEATLFGLDPNKVVLQNISLSPVECERLDIPQGHEFDIQKDLEHASAYIESDIEKDVVTEVPYRRNHTNVSQVHATVDVAAELNRLSDGQTELKDQMTSSFDRIFSKLGNLAKKVNVDGGDECHSDIHVAAETNASLKQLQNVDGVDKGKGLATENETSFEQAVGHQKSVGQFVEAELSAHQPVEQVVKDGQVHELRVREYAPEEQNMKEVLMPGKIGEKSVTKALKLKLPAKHKNSPFGNKLGSSGSRSALANMKKRIFRMKHPFVKNIGKELKFETICNFASWVDTDLLIDSFDQIYEPSVNALEQKFDFGGYVVDKKEWFFNLNYNNIPLDTTQLDVILYYLRKRVKYDKNVSKQVTTTDTFFDQSVRELYNEYITHGRSHACITDSHLIAKYISGCYIRCSLPWHLVDDVLFPVRIADEDWHWVLARLSFKDWCIYVYDSMPLSGAEQAVYNAEIIESVYAYCVLLPLFLLAIGFYASRNEIRPVVQTTLTDPFPIVFERSMEDVAAKSYGVFLASFAEYYIQDKVVPSGEYDIEELRTRYGALLWEYGQKKIKQNAVSDDE